MRFASDCVISESYWSPDMDRIQLLRSVRSDSLMELLESHSTSRKSRNLREVLGKKPLLEKIDVS